MHLPRAALDPPPPAPVRAWWGLAVPASLWALWATGALWLQVAGHGANIVDFLPLWLGGRALLFRLDPTDPAVLRRLFDAADMSLHPGGFASYYPQTASLLFAPLGYWNLEGIARGVQVGLGFALLAGAALGGGAGLRGAPRVLVAALAIGLTASLPVSWILLNMGQSNCLLVLLTGLGLSLVANRRDGLAGLVVGLGIALKLFPAVFLVAAVSARRWRLVGLALLLPVLLGAASLALYAGPWAGSPWGGGAAWFVGAPGQRGTLSGPLVALLWPLRTWVLGLGTVGLSAWCAWRPDPQRSAALAALWLAWVGAVMAGGPIGHQGVVVLPAAAFLLGWPWATARRWWAALGVGLVGVAVWQSGVFAAHQAQAMQWLPVGVAVWAGCALRLVDALLPAGTVAGPAGSGAAAQGQDRLEQQVELLP